MIFENMVTIDYVNIYDKYSYSQTFFDRMYHGKEDDVLFSHYSNKIKMIQFIKYKGKMYLYVNIPKPFFVDDFTVSLVIDDKLSSLFKIPPVIDFKYDSSEVYDSKIALFYDFSIEINYSYEEMVQRFKDSDYPDEVEIYNTPTFRSYEVHNREYDYGLADRVTVLEDNKIFSAVKDRVLHGKSFIDLVSDLKYFMDNKKIIVTEKYISQFDDSITLVAICCGYLVDYGNAFIE